MAQQIEKKNNEKDVFCGSPDEKDLLEASEEAEGLPELEDKAAGGKKKASIEVPNIKKK